MVRPAFPALRHVVPLAAPAPQPMAPRLMTPAPRPMVPHPAPAPRGNDFDADNNGGPDDGDGNR
ncbi:hypothetical protein SAMN04487916_103140 [Arthrobacter sp. ov407]|nr:hypothetical protein SAMN04487916_103140 [Arthrobacter sp. ov407]